MQQLKNVPPSRQDFATRNLDATRDEQKISATTVSRFIFDDTQESETTARQPDLFCALSMEAPVLRVVFKTAQSNRRLARRVRQFSHLCSYPRQTIEGEYG
jgi:hypothetical protein